MTLLAGAALLCAGCGEEAAEAPQAPGAPAPFELNLPAGFPPMEIPADNPTTVAGVALGRALYYDVRLSPDGSRACAHCHLQAHGFTRPDVTGVLPHVNLAWAQYFLWDGHVFGTLEEAMRFEVRDFFQTDPERLRAPDLAAKFQAAFGTPEPTVERAALALAQFQRTMVSSDAPIDRWLDGDEAALDEAALRGMALFYDERAECFHCHATRLFTDNRFHDIGLEADPTGTGRGAFTGRAQDDGLFKTPTLRNVAATAPYMHDDRFATLEEVVAFYSGGVQFSRNVDTLVANAGGGGAGLTAEEQADLVAFLHALTDDRFLTDPALGPP